MTERTYTQADMARAWDEGRREGRGEAVLEFRFGVIETTPNPYEQGEA